MSEALLWCGLGLLFLGGLGWIADRWKDRSVVQVPRQDQRVPARERMLLGDDWRVPVTPFLAARFESRTRTRLVIAAQCGADPCNGKECDVA